MSLLAGAQLGRYSNLQPENPRTLEVEVKATLKSHVVAESNDIVESGDINISRVRRCTWTGW
jgi:hypothetical protein